VTLTNPEAPAPTKAQVANVLRIRDEIARIIGSARTLSEHSNRPDKTSAALARAVAERLIEAGFVDFEAIHRAVIEDMHDEDDEAEDEDDFLLDL